MWIKEAVKKILYKERYSSETLVDYLRKRGGKIGSNVTFINPRDTVVDYGNLILIEIGNNVCITAGCTILAHDFSYSVSNYALGKLPHVKKPTKIGNNVFLGMNSIVLMGTQIEDNVIIGAGSVVSGHIEGNSVYAGNPARKISTLEEYTEKRMKCLEKYAYIWANSFVNRMGRLPEIVEMNVYRWMFFDKTQENMEKYYHGDQFYDDYAKLPPKYNSVEDLLETFSDIKF